MLGESALWDAESGRLLWVDILNGLIFARDLVGGPIASLQLDCTVGAVALRESGGLIAATGRGLLTCDVDTGVVTTLAEIEPERAGNRMNDGAVDPAGRFWFGSMDLAEVDGTGALYNRTPDGRVRKVLDSIICSNGPAWSPDGTTMYHVDSGRRLITAYEFDVACGQVGAGRIFVDDTSSPWFPDGVTVDAEGYVWNCKWDGGLLVRYAPDGSIDRALKVPVPRPTRCAFVGPELDQMAITSARVGLTDPQLEQAPLSGRVLLTEPGVRGLPASRHAG